MKKLIFLLLTFTVCSCSENKSPIPMGNIIDNNIVTSKTSDSSGVTNLFAINSENALLISQHFQQQERSKSNLRLSSNIAKKSKNTKIKIMKLFALLLIMKTIKDILLFLQIEGWFQF